MSDPSKNIPTSVATAEQWIGWHQSLKKVFSKKESNEYWVRFWTQRAGAGSNADSHGLRDYMRSQGVELTTDWSGSMTDGIADVTEWFGDWFKVIRNIFLGAVILIVALITIYLISSIKKGKSPAEMFIDVRTLGASSKLKALGGGSKLIG